MSYEITSNPSQKTGTRSVMKAPGKPSKKDFFVSSVSLEPAENGVIIECRHRMKPEIEAKIRKSTGKDYVPYETTNQTSKYVAKDMSEAAEFISAKLAGEEYGEKEV